MAQQRYLNAKHKTSTTPPVVSPKAINRRIKARSNSVNENRGVAGASRKNPQAGNKMGQGFAEQAFRALKKDSKNPSGIQRINKFKGFK